MKKPGNAGGAKARQEGGCVESMMKQEELSKVEETPKQGREAESQKWSWVEAEGPSVVRSDRCEVASYRFAMV